MLSLIFIFLLVFFYLKRENKLFLIIFFFILTNGFQIIPSNLWFFGFPFLDKPTDVLLIATIAIFLIDLNNIAKLIKSKELRRYLLLILLMVFFASCAAFSLNVPFSEQLRILRVEILPFIILPLLRFKATDFQYLFEFLYTVTILQSLLFLLQIVTGKILLFSPVGGVDVNVGDDESTGWIRYYNLPVYLILFFYFSLLQLQEKYSFKNFVLFLVLSLTVIAPLHRGMFAATLVALLLYNILFNFNGKTFAFVISTMVIALLSINIVPGLSERFFSAFEDLQTVKSIPITMISEKDSTFAFRIMHLYERLQYISQSTLRLLFGIGLVPEDISVAKKLPLLIGNYKDYLGGIKKIETSDLAWSTPVLRFGLFGVFVIVYFLKIFFSKAQHYNKNKIVIALILYVLSAILGSFTGSELTSYHLKTLTLFALFVYMSNFRFDEHIYNNTKL